MLVLSRKQGETIRIGDNIEVTILATAGNRVRIGIAAPRDMSIVRKELMQRDVRPYVVPSHPTSSGEVCEIELTAHVV